eukprot:870661-Rhodomonas_salina.4
MVVPELKDGAVGLGGGGQAERGVHEAGADSKLVALRSEEARLQARGSSQTPSSWLFAAKRHAAKSPPPAPAELPWNSTISARPAPAS